MFLCILNKDITSFSLDGNNTNKDKYMHLKLYIYACVYVYIGVYIHIDISNKNLAMRNSQSHKNEYFFWPCRYLDIQRIFSYFFLLNSPESCSSNLKNFSKIY